MPACKLVLTAADVLVERDVETVDQIGPVSTDEVRAVLCEVLAGFRDEIAQPRKHIVADPVVIRYATVFYDFSDVWVEVFSLALKAKIEGHVVDACAEV